MTCGIYAIDNKITGKRYVGQSVQIEHRLARHFRELRKINHSNQKLQRAYNKYGRDCFETVILETCDRDQLPLREQFYIDQKKWRDLYNISKYTHSLYGNRNPFYGKRHSESVKNKLSARAKGTRCGKNNSNFGNKNSPEVRLSMSLGRSGSLTIEKVEQIVTMLKMCKLHQEIADKFGIGRTTVTRISNGTRWTNITGGPVIPVQYDEKGNRVFTEEHKAKIGNGRRGIKHTEESKQQMSKTRKALYGKRGDCE